MSTRFGDVYFSRDSGLDETRHVFLAHNRLAERWAALPADGRFVLGETGFGTGLNVLCAWQLWRRCAPAGARLHVISTEKYPIPPEQLARALALWPELAEFSQALLAQYAALGPGWHRFSFDEGAVTLTLLVGDALDTLPQLDAASSAVDAWFGWLCPGAQPGALVARAVCPAGAAVGAGGQLRHVYFCWRGQARAGRGGL